jgi:membrane associated rhomboid family serine protease
MKFWSATRWLITINVVIYVADILSFWRLNRWGAFSVDLAIYHVQLWRFVTFQFLHADAWHIFFNMATLYYFGPILERSIHRRAFIIFYLVSGLCGAALYLLLWRLNVLNVGPRSALIGASASVLGVMAGATTLAPHMTLTLWFPPIQVRLSTLLWIFLLIAFLTVWTSGPNAGGEAAHLGGAAAGFLLVRNIPRLRRLAGGKTSRRRFWRPGDPQSNFFTEEFRK